MAKLSGVKVQVCPDAYMRPGFEACLVEAQRRAQEVGLELDVEKLDHSRYHELFDDLAGRVVILRLPYYRRNVREAWLELGDRVVALFGPPPEDGQMVTVRVAKGFWYGARSSYLEGEAFAQVKAEAYGLKLRFEYLDYFMSLAEIKREYLTTRIIYLGAFASGIYFGSLSTEVVRRLCQLAVIRAIALFGARPYTGLLPVSERLGESILTMLPRVPELEVPARRKEAEAVVERLQTSWRERIAKGGGRALATGKSTLKKVVEQGRQALERGKQTLEQRTAQRRQLQAAVEQLQKSRGQQWYREVAQLVEQESIAKEEAEERLVARALESGEIAALEAKE